MNTTERSRHESQRSECYRLLAALFYPPAQSLLVKDSTCLELAALLKDLYPEASASAATMHTELTAHTETELRVDHAALFVGPFALKAPPYGSVFLEDSRRVQGSTTLAAMNLYAEAGLQLTLQEPADHIAVELEFMHYLSALAAEALAAGQLKKEAELAQRQAQFLRQHLGAWFPAFCAAIGREAETVYFRALAACLQSFLDAEMRHLNLEPATACRCCSNS